MASGTIRQQNIKKIIKTLGESLTIGANSEASKDFDFTNDGVGNYIFMGLNDYGFGAGVIMRRMQYYPSIRRLTLTLRNVTGSSATISSETAISTVFIKL